MKLWTKNFTLLWQGYLVSTLGSQVFFLGLLLWVKDLTGSAAAVGTLLLLTQLPVALLSPLSGALVDRFSKKKMLVLTDFLSFLVILLFLGLTFVFQKDLTVTLYLLFGLSFLLGILFCLNQPTVLALLPQLSSLEKLHTANAVLQSSAQVARIVASAASGLVYQVLGPFYLMTVNAFSFLFGSISEVFIRVEETPRATSHETFKESVWTISMEIKDGFSYLFDSKGKVIFFAFVCLLNFLLASLFVLLPFFVEERLELEGRFFGILLSIEAAFMVLGASLVGFQKGEKSNSSLKVLISLLAVFMALLLLSVTSHWLVAAFFMGVIGLGVGAANTLVMTVLQKRTPQVLLGKVIGAVIAAATLMQPIGMGLFGWMKDGIAGDPYFILWGFGGGFGVLLVTIAGLTPSLRAFIDGDQAVSMSYLRSISDGGKSDF
jgi:MFS transporter, DHA3 family, macrolide efflux protein